MSRLDSLISLVLDSVDSANTRRVYKSQLTAFCEWHDERTPLSKAVVQEYVRHLRKLDKGPSTCNLALSALRKLASEAADNGIISSDIAQGIAKIPNVKRQGHKTGQWLTIEQARQLVKACDLETLRGMRDRVMLGLLLECGLRREEAAVLQVDQIKKREGRLVIADLLSKGNRTRTVPVSERTAERIKQWKRAAGIKDGFLLRAVNKADELEVTYGEHISAAAIYKRVRELANDVLGIDLRPHDLRRTFGRLARKSGAELDQIQQTLGHSDPRTTLIYLGEYQDLEAGSAPCDKIDLEEGEE